MKQIQFFCLWASLVAPIFLGGVVAGQFQLAYAQPAPEVVNSDQGQSKDLKMKKTKQFIARESSSDKIYQISANDSEDAFHVFAKVIQGQDQSDTGNVDIDLVEIKNLPIGNCIELLADDSMAE